MVVVVMLNVPQVATTGMPGPTVTPLMNASPNTIMSGRATCGESEDDRTVEAVRCGSVGSLPNTTEVAGTSTSRTALISTAIASR